MSDALTISPEITTAIVVNAVAQVEALAENVVVYAAEANAATVAVEAMAVVVVEGLAGTGPGETSTAWDDITGKPVTLAGYGITDAAPAVHGHAIAQVTGLQVALDAKLDDAQATPAGLALLGAADAAAQRTALGLGTAATADSTAFEVAGAVTAHVAAGDPHPQYLTPAEASAAYAATSHTHTASQISDSTVTGRSLITAADAAAGRTALGLGTAATQNTGTSGATVPLLNGANTHSGNNTYTAQFTYRPASGSGYITANKATATDLAGFRWGNELGAQRWIFATGSTTDDDLWLIRYNDDGTFLNTVLSFSSATGMATFGTGAIFLANIAQGTSPAANNNMLFSANIAGATTAQAVVANGNVQSGVTAEANYFRTSAGTQAATFTLTHLQHFVAAQGVIGAGSTVTNQTGFVAPPSLIGATNNYGFRGSIPSGIGRWNFFAEGTANNAFAGNVRIGSTAAPTVALDVTGSAAISGTLTIGGNQAWHTDTLARQYLFADNNAFTDTSPVLARNWHGANQPSGWHEVIHIPGVAGTAHALQIAYFGGDVQNYWIRHRNDTNGWGGTSATWRWLFHSGNLTFGAGLTYSEGVLSGTTSLQDRNRIRQRMYFFAGF